jgi:heme A synthase
MGLALIFLLGMAVNLIGGPSQTSGAAHLASNVFLAVHVLIALGLLIGAVLLLRAAARLDRRRRNRAIAGAAAIAVAIAGGILTVITSNNWWSYAMAVGFIAALLAYGSLLLPSGRGDDPPGVPIRR